MIHLRKGLSNKSVCGEWADAVPVVGTKEFADTPEEKRCKRCNRWAPKTKSDKIVHALEMRGCEEVEGGRYRKFTVPGSAGTAFYFVGRAGALRKERSVSNSRSLTNSVSKLFGI